jgi:hypothetical protein
MSKLVVFLLFFAISCCISPYCITVNEFHVNSKKIKVCDVLSIKSKGLYLVPKSSTSSQGIELFTNSGSPTGVKLNFRLKNITNNDTLQIDFSKHTSWIIDRKGQIIPLDILYLQKILSLKPMEDQEFDVRVRLKYIVSDSLLNYENYTINYSFNPSTIISKVKFNTPIIIAFRK